MIWWLAVATATDDLQAQLHALTTRKHACDDAIPALDARLAARPEDQEALFGRADCRYQVGRLVWALEDVQRLTAPGVDALVLEAVLLARLERAREAQQRVKRLGRDTAGRTRAEAVLAMAEGDPATGWARVDHALTIWPGDPHSLRAAGELAALDPDHVSALAAAALERPTLFAEAYNRGVNRLNAQDGLGCLGHVVQAEVLAGPVEAPVLARLGHQCAALAGELVLAAEWLSRAGGVGFADPNAVLVQAELMRRGGDPVGALLLFDDAVPITLEQERLRDTGRVTILTGDGQLDAAVGASGQASGVSRANLAVALKRAGRQDEALELLTSACEDMTGDDAVTCWQTVARWKG
jgi:hypothetical protein